MNLHKQADWSEDRADALASAAWALEMSGARLGAGRLLARSRELAADATRWYRHARQLRARAAACERAAVLA